jgi:hypothetical protein
LIGQNIRIEPIKMLKLLNYDPRWHRSMQSYKHVESLVRLYAFSKAGIVYTKATGGVGIEEVDDVEKSL